MNILFDNIIFSKEKQGGISNYWYELIKNYSDNDKVQFYEERNALNNIYRSSLNLKNIVPHKELPLILSRLLPIKFDTKNDALLYHSSFYRKLKTNARVTEITTIHDFLHDYVISKLKRSVHNQLKYSSIKRANGIICISNNTYADLKKFCQPRKEQKIAIIYNGVSKVYSPLKVKGLQGLVNGYQIDKFILYVGSRYKYKNFEFVLSVLKEAPDYKLVVVGNKFSGEELKRIDKSILTRIINLSNISNEDLNVLYNNAKVLIYPSSYEGFGLPIIEAMKAGCPVIAQKLSSIPEVAGNAGILLDQLDVNFCISKIKDLETESKRKEYVEAGFENAKRFDWEKCQTEIKEFYQDVYSY
jgi:glycosyltransferase involved in cell wall biosynthesis